MTIDKDGVVRVPHKCVHFKGIQKVCGAGIDPKTVRDDSGTGRYRWPCLALIGDKMCTTMCPSYRQQTKEERDAEDAKFQAAIDRFHADMKAARCPECRQAVESVRQDGKCVYANPCGHRVGQGQATTVGASMGVRVD